MEQSIYIRTKSASIYTETVSEKLWREDEFFRTELPTRNFRVSIKFGLKNEKSHFSITAIDKATAYKQVEFLVGLLLEEKNVRRAAYNFEGLDEWRFISNPMFKQAKEQKSILGKVKKSVKRKIVELFELED